MINSWPKFKEKEGKKEKYQTSMTITERATRLVGAGQDLNETMSLGVASSTATHTNTNDSNKTK